MTSSQGAEESKARILVIDDEPAMLEACEETLTYHGYDVHTRDSSEAGVAAVSDGTFDLVLLDLKMPGKDGMDVLRELKQIDNRLLKVMVTAYPTISTAVEAVKEGAFDYLPKPFSPDQLLITVDRALQQMRLADENRMLRRALKFRPGFEGIVARSAAMERVMDLVERLTESESSVVIQGETGTGKELIARSLHVNSPRRQGPFVPVDCAALPDNLLESELFGHERGAFTGAFSRKLGLLETAQRGTVFLDEIATLSVDLQVKLLRALQERTLRRLGGQEIIKVDIRLLSATNESLEQAIEDGRFRQDLYYRLNVLTIILPPLRDRSGDILLLADHFIKELNESNRKQVSGLSTEAGQLLEQYSWPGNVRQLRNVVESAFNLTDGGQLQPLALPADIADQTAPKAADEASLADARGNFERHYVEAALSDNHGNVSSAARQAGVHRSSFQRLMKKHGIRSATYR